MDYICTNEPIKQAALAAVGAIQEHLCKGEKVLWLLSGGSSLTIAVMASQNKRLKKIDLSNLYISVTDERFGPIGHDNENWQQLIDAGFWLHGANLYRPLTGRDIETTTTAFNNWLETQFKTADFKLGIFGIGVDGHTAGIKPFSSATESTDYATSYSCNKFERITISFFAIEQLDQAIIQASDDEKQPIVNEFIYEKFPIDKQPAQILKKIPNISIYTNIVKKVY